MTGSQKPKTKYEYVFFMYLSIQEFESQKQYLSSIANTVRSKQLQQMIL